MANRYELDDPLVGELLGDAGPFVIPLYQRGYAWEEQDVADYISDIQSIADQLAAGEKPELYFFGAVLTVKKSDGPVRHEYEVVDGQQRLTTFFLTLAEIRRALLDLAASVQDSALVEVQDQCKAMAEDIYEHFLTVERRNDKHQKYRAPKLRLSAVDHSTFVALVEDGPDGVVEPDEAGSPLRLWHAASAIRDELVRDTSTFESLRVPEKWLVLSRLYSALVANSYVIFASTSDAVRAYRLFTGLNDRGHPLEAADLLRTRSLEILADFPSHQKQVAEVWDERLIRAEADEVRTFLTAYLESHAGVRAPSRDLFREYRKRWFAQNALTTSDAAAVVAATKALSHEFAIFRQLTSGDWPATVPIGSDWQASRLKGLIKQTRQTSSIPLLLSAATRPGDFRAILDAVDRFSIRYQLAKGHPSPFGDTLFACAASVRYNPAFGVAELLQEFATLASKYADDALFESRLRTVKYTTARPALLKYFLATLDGYADSHESGNRPPKLDDSHVADMGKADLDHIYAKNVAARAQDEDMEIVKNQLANLSPLIWGKNRALKNKSYREKRKAYQASGFFLAREIGRRQYWDIDAFRDRETALVSLARAVFALPEPLATADRKVWTGHAWLVQQNPDSTYLRDVVGRSYEYPRNARNGLNMKVGDVLVCYTGDRFAVAGKRIFGVGRIEYIDGNGTNLVASYDRYAAIKPPLGFDELGGDPRSNLRNPINALPPGFVQIVLARLGLGSPDDLPEVREV